ncbi:MAG: SDR family oxidoreductase [Acidimicrobiales bacterium]|jgi:NAD(P)-dependent dehydrogenase (short-subunit alcohol dehydrogenase family)
MRILVTGAGSGVGKAASALLAARGHEVIATARDLAALEDLDVAARLRLDVTDAASIEALLAELGFVDGLVNNAAVAFDGPVEHLAMDHVRQMFETNVYGPVRLIQAFVPGMRERRAGVVVNISSVAGRVAQPLDGYYSATKHALEAISEALYVELAHFGVRVVIIEPGFIAPSMKVHRSGGVPPAYDELDAQLAELASKMRSGSRPGPEIVAEAIADAIDGSEGPLRRRVGDDANLILSARSSLGDEEFETAMREVVGLTW